MPAVKISSLVTAFSVSLYTLLCPLPLILQEGKLYQTETKMFLIGTAPPILRNGLEAGSIWPVEFLFTGVLFFFFFFKGLGLS